MKHGSLQVFGFEGTPRELLERLVEENQERLLLHFEDVTMHPESLAIPSESHDKHRQQYKAQSFHEILARFASKSIHALGLVNLDLFVPELNFVFGTAQYGGNAIVALPRLRQSYYGQSDDEELFFQRTVKEVFHELGHVLRLRHCTKFCVMQFSNSLVDTDNKPESYCSDCLRKLKWESRTQ
ncbi:MAG: archaemetzincin family Zn-dependent metalloprotease [Promethearchaeota archaeon]